jgi:transposase
LSFAPTRRVAKQKLPSNAKALPSPHLRGRPPLNERAILDAILWKLSRNAPWYDLPACYPSHQTCYRCYCQWHRLGLLDKLVAELLHDLEESAGIHPNLVHNAGYVTLAPDFQIRIRYITVDVCVRS